MRHRWRLVVALVLVVLVAALAWAGAEAYHIYSGISTIANSKVDRIATEPKIRRFPMLSGHDRINILVLGSDNDRKLEEARPLTQSMIVVTINPVDRTVGMLSIPRDFWVPIQGHGWAKIDLANKYGGVALARQTVEKLFGITIDYYAWVGLSGFARVIDTFHGIDLNVTHPILDDYYPDDTRPGDPYAFTRIFIPPGWRHLSGRQALQYVRSRHGDLVGDFGRSARQQQVLLSLRKKINTMNALLNLPTLVDELRSSVRSDLASQGLHELEAFANFSRHIDPANIHRVVLQYPTYCQYSTSSDGQSILVPNWSAIRPVVTRMFAPIKLLPPRPTSERGHRSISRPTPRPTITATIVPRHHESAPGLQLKNLPGNVYFSRDGGIFELTRSRRLLQVLPWGGVGMPAISPSGRRLAFMDFSTYASDIWLYDLASHAAQKITADGSRNVHNNLWAAWPAWTSNGSDVLYSSDRQKLRSAPSETRSVDFAIWEQPVKGGRPVQLTTPAVGAGGDTDPTPLPHGLLFLYVHWHYDPYASQPYSQLVVHDPATGAAWTLTPPGQRAIQPSVNRAGTEVTYVESRQGTSKVVVAPLRRKNGGYVLGAGRTLASGEVAQPAFTPDGKWVSYVAAVGSDDFSLYLVRQGGGRAIRLDTGAAVDAISRPVWTR